MSMSKWKEWGVFGWSLVIFRLAALAEIETKFIESLRGRPRKEKSVCFPFSLCVWEMLSAIYTAVSRCTDDDGDSRFLWLYYERECVSAKTLSPCQKTISTWQQEWKWTSRQCDIPPTKSQQQQADVIQFSCFYINAEKFSNFRFSRRGLCVPHSRPFDTYDVACVICRRPWKGSDTLHRSIGSTLALCQFLSSLRGLSQSRAQPANESLIAPRRFAAHWWTIRSNSLTIWLRIDRLGVNIFHSSFFPRQSTLEMSFTQYH